MARLFIMLYKKVQTFKYESEGSCMFDVLKTMLQVMMTTKGEILRCEDAPNFSVCE